MKIVTRRTQIKKRLDAIAVKRLLFCAACHQEIDPAREPGLPVRDGSGSAWHAGCWALLHPPAPPSGRDRRNDLYAEDA